MPQPRSRTRRRRLVDQVVELGPGLGALTYALLARDCDVLAVELDRDMVRVLRERNSQTQERLDASSWGCCGGRFRQHIRLLVDRSSS